MGERDGRISVTENDGGEVGGRKTKGEERR